MVVRDRCEGLNFASRARDHLINFVTLQLPLVRLNPSLVPSASCTRIPSTSCLLPPLSHSTRLTVSTAAASRCTNTHEPTLLDDAETHDNEEEDEKEHRRVPPPYTHTSRPRPPLHVALNGLSLDSTRPLISSAQPLPHPTRSPVRPALPSDPLSRPTRSPVRPALPSGPLDPIARCTALPALLA
ncbi:hypothetical protein HETIRDRAFT_451098 [Heterobasidion irregulare TC 32-1]|uniref:Uncharacterized protein n=1 Tax=Heterobasidion irregulare (strain TC 32-1) TaxID=747525 RepID=W4K870_HETIT|nr:uncharacterized protein HETIRDRAFT_451098 [Heterobasidion irregulare TC 32-1]ETW81261.1 hypothetical protein HETIRDRAFT_451098 [Heterobasidion irregulare TC 32-1]